MIKIIALQRDGNAFAEEKEKIIKIIGGTQTEATSNDVEEAILFDGFDPVHIDFKDMPTLLGYLEKHRDEVKKEKIKRNSQRFLQKIGIL